MKPSHLMTSSLTTFFSKITTRSLLGHWKFPSNILKGNVFLGSNLRSWPEIVGKGRSSLGLCHRQEEQRSCPRCSAGGRPGLAGQWWSVDQRCCTAQSCARSATAPSSRWRPDNCRGGGSRWAGCRRTRASRLPSGTEENNPICFWGRVHGSYVHVIIATAAHPSIF